MKEVVGGVFFSPFSFLAGIFLDLGKLCIPYFRILMFPKLPQYFYSFIAYCFPSLPQATSPSKHPTLHSDLNIFCSKGSLALFSFQMSKVLAPFQTPRSSIPTSLFLCTSGKVGLLPPLSTQVPCTQTLFTPWLLSTS